MKTRSKIISALAALLVTSSLIAEQKPTRFVDRLLLEFGPKALVSPTVPTGIGGGVGIGLSFRDFNLLINPTFLMAEPLGAQKPMITTTAHIETKFVIAPNFLTLLPYLEAGFINTQVVRPDTTLSGKTTALYAELGIGVDIQLTHEISIIPRLGIAHGMVYQLPDSNNHSGPTAALAVRYTFGRPESLDF